MEPDEGYFGERVAATYDEHSASMFDPAVVAPAVDRLAELAGDGRALEFAIGTGRIALPLAKRGVRVAGMDNSEAMLARLREKPGAERIEALVGDTPGGVGGLPAGQYRTEQDRVAAVRRRNPAAHELFVSCSSGDEAVPAGADATPAAQPKSAVVAISAARMDAEKVQPDACRPSVDRCLAAVCDDANGVGDRRG